MFRCLGGVAYSTQLVQLCASTCVASGSCALGPLYTCLKFVKHVVRTTLDMAWWNAINLQQW